MTKNKVNYSFWLGLAAMAFFVLVTVLEWRWSLLKYKQFQFGFKLTTGFFFLGFLFHQWMLTRNRVQPKVQGQRLRQSLSRHKWIGIALPLLLLLHTQNWGISFNYGLSLVFGLSMIFGLSLDIVAKYGSLFWSQTWIILHIICSTLLMGLLALHLYIALSY